MEKNADNQTFKHLTNHVEVCQLPYIQVQDKANMFTWTSILTINGRPLTQNFTKITMEEVRAHAQVYQDRSLREAQNSEMLIQCLKASVSRAVYNKVYLQRERYTIYRKNTNEPVQDGVCFLKTIIDNYHSNTRSMTKQIRKQLASLNLYMRNVAKGDVKKLCQHTRELLYELDAAGEVTNDLLANLIEALKEAPDSNFPLEGLLCNPIKKHIIIVSHG